MHFDLQLVYRKLCAGVALGALVAAGTSFASSGNDGSQRASQDTTSALVQLNGDPLAMYTKTKPPQGKKIDFDNNTVKAYRAQLSALMVHFEIVRGMPHGQEMNEEQQ